jgi:hypothetical protein
MANSIFPDIDSAGGIVFRNPDGTCLLPLPDIVNADCPTTTYKSTCDLTALPSNCDARIEPRQINAIVSELLNFAACIDPTGTWNCDSLRNLCAAFTAWAQINSSRVFIGDNPPPNPTHGMLWWESDTGLLLIYYDDGNSVQWVSAGGTSKSVVMDGISIVGVGNAADPHAVGLVDCGVW